MSTMFKSFPVDIKANSNKNLVFKISTSSPDRDEDILVPTGAKLENYRNNAVVLFAHHYDGLPIGRSLRETVYNDYIESEVEFAPTAFAQDVKKLCEQGFLNSASVGFIGITDEPIEDSKYGRKYTEWELLEWSIVPVPANASCLIQDAKAKGISLDAIEKELKILEEDFVEVKTIITKPGWDETETSFRFRVRDPGLFQEGSFRTVPIKKDKPRVNSIMGRLKDETTLTVQSIIFPKEDDWDLADAKKWLGEHEDLTKGCDQELERKEPVFELDMDEKVLKITDFEGREKRMSFEFLEACDFEALKHNSDQLGELTKYASEKCIGLPGQNTIEGVIEALEQKAGATLSAKTKKMLDEIYENIQKCNEELRKFIDSSGVMPEGEGDKIPGDLLTAKTEMSEELKQALDEIKSQVLILCDEIKAVKSHDPIKTESMLIKFKDSPTAKDTDNTKPKLKLDDKFLTQLMELFEKKLDEKIKGGI